MTIGDIQIKKIFDSRGDTTIEVVVTNEHKQSFSCQVPSGKSTGEKEAVAFGYEKARQVLAGVISKQLVGKMYHSAQEVDRALLDIDDSPKKIIIGGNVALGISLAAARALAAEKRLQLWELLGREFFPGQKTRRYPFVFSNVINGGSHATNRLDIQEYMVVMRPHDNLFAGIERLGAFYRSLKELLQKRRDAANIPIGDEGGFDTDFSSNEEPLEMLEHVRKKDFADFSFAVDAAASQFFKNNAYVFEGKEISTTQLSGVYEGWRKKFGSLISIEDPFAQTDEQGFRELRGRDKTLWVVGDDLTCTNAARIAELAKSGVINAVIIKANQVGTVTETCRAMQEAKARGLKVIVSHRSAETDDHFLAHIARAANADAVKMGAPARERLGKYNELLRVYEA